MNLYIVRHGQTDWNKQNLFQGRKDIPLNEIGIKQAHEIADKLKNKHLDYIFTSPLKRAIHTASIINEFHQLEITISQEIIERNLGDLEGKSIADYSSPYFWNTILNLDNPNGTLYNVEALAHMLNRAKLFLQHLLKYYKDKDILIVCHGGIMLPLLLLLGEVDTTFPLSEYRIDNCRCYHFSNPTIQKIDYKNNP